MRNEGILRPSPSLSKDDGWIFPPLRIDFLRWMIAGASRYFTEKHRGTRDKGSRKLGKRSNNHVLMTRGFFSDKEVLY